MGRSQVGNDPEGVSRTVLKAPCLTELTALLYPLASCVLHQNFKLETHFNMIMNVHTDTLQQAHAARQPPLYIQNTCKLHHLVPDMTHRLKTLVFRVQTHTQKALHCKVNEYLIKQSDTTMTEVLMEFRTSSKLEEMRSKGRKHEGCVVGCSNLFFHLLKKNLSEIPLGFSA